MTLEEKKEYSKRYYQANKERLLAKQKEYKDKNRQELRVKARAYNALHKEDIKAWSLANRESRLETYRRYNSKHKDDRINNKVEAILYKGGKCNMCGLEYNTCNGSVFDFHHINPEEKDFTISQRLVRQSISEEVKQELDKCILVCANCHRIIHNKSY